MTMRIAGLVRLSKEPEKEEDKKTWHLVQRKVIEESCEDLFKKDFEIEWYQGIESATKRDRPILDRLLADAETDKWNAVVVYDSSRWSRDVTEAEEVRDTLQRCKKPFYIGRTLFDPQDPSHRFTGRILTATAQHETDLFKKRVMAKKFLKGSAGGWPYGEVPPGRIITRDKAGNETWSIDAAMKHAIDRAYHLIVDKKQSLVRVAKALGWGSPQLVRKRILASGGIGRYTQKNPETGEMVTREVKIPALLTDIQIAQVKKVWEANKVSVGKHEGWNDYLLRGKLRCGNPNCGSVLVGTFKNGRRKYVHVHSEWKDAACVRTVFADIRTRDAGGVEDAVMFAISDQIRDPKNRKTLTKDIEAQLGSQQGRINEVERRIAGLDKSITELQRKISLKSELDGIRGSAKAQIVADINALSDQLTAAMAEREEAQAERASIDASKADAERLAAYLAYLLEGARWDKANKLRALDALFGEGSLRRKKNVGIYIDRQGNITMPTNIPLSAIVARVEPDVLGRPRLRPKELVPTRTPTRSCIARGCPRSR